jgi:hypothetical protein
MLYRWGAVIRVLVGVVVGGTALRRDVLPKFDR